MKKIDCSRIGTFLSETMEVRKSFWVALLAGMAIFMTVLILTTYFSVRHVFYESSNPDPLELSANCTETDEMEEAVQNEPRLLYCLRYVKTLSAELNKHLDHCIDKEQLARDRDILSSDHPFYESLLPQKWICVLLCDTPMASCMHGERCVAVKTDEFELLLDGDLYTKSHSKSGQLKGKKLVVGGNCLCNKG